MNHKVLLADDSLTIQKVIKITLANQPYDITEASSEDELFQKLAQVNPRIVFLDFNLSEKFSGYDLTARIRKTCPGAKVLLLLGTFDTVDDASMEKCGASDKIVKPFDSNKFIAICKQLIETGDGASAPVEVEITFEEAQSLPSDEDLSMPDEDQWTMSTTAAKAPEPKTELAAESPASRLDALTKEISDWGMSVPGVIGGGVAGQPELPPVIGEVKSLEAQRQKVSAAAAPASKPEPQATAPAASAGDVKFPETSDLDYPTIEEMQSSEASAPAKEESKKREPSQLVSIDIFNEKPLELDLQTNFVEDETDINSLEAQIADEVEGNLWQADEFEELKREVSSKIESMKEELGPELDAQAPKNSFDENLFRPLDEGESHNWTGTEAGHEPKFTAAPAAAQDLSAIRGEVEAMVKKYVKEYMDEMFKKNVEKISWEVIPDLAENLIRQELGKISHKIISDQD